MVGFRLQSNWDVQGVCDGVQLKWYDAAVNVGCGDPCAWRLNVEVVCDAAVNIVHDLVINLVCGDICSCCEVRVL